MKAVPACDFARPKLRAGVKVEIDRSSVAFTYRNQGCSLSVEGGGEQLVQLVSALTSGKGGIQELCLETGIDEQEVVGVIHELDKLGLLTEAQRPLSASVSTGKQFYHDLVRTVDAATAKVSTNRFVELLRSRAATRSQLIGYAIEYYYVVRLAPRLMAPALAKADDDGTQLALQQFFASELFHDRMMGKALDAVGVTTQMLRSCQPLPYTFAVCASLGAYAAQHPLSFKAALFLFERPANEFNELFRDECERLGLGKGFWGPVLQHAEVNDDYDHGNITRTLLERVPCVANEERTVTLKHMVILVESLVKMEDEIIVHYAQESSIASRFSGVLVN